MRDAILHRGPDDHGIFTSPDSPIARGHRRLSIIDTSPAGHQPMTSHCGRWTLVFNGEIYNARELAASLDESIPMRGHSDTEVLLESIARDGVEAAIAPAVGMFAFAAWDHRDRKLYLMGSDWHQAALCGAARWSSRICLGAAFISSCTGASWICVQGRSRQTSTVWLHTRSDHHL